jgi:hypothetical protein
MPRRKDSMMNDEFIKNVMELYNNPLFKKGFSEFVLKMQQEGIEAARKFWSINPDKDKLAENAPEIFEQMIDFYSSFGFVPKSKFDELAKENEELKKENEFLLKTIKEMNNQVFAEGSSKIQEAWKETIDKQMEVAKEISKNFLDMFKKEREK